MLSLSFCWKPQQYLMGFSHHISKSRVTIKWAESSAKTYSTTKRLKILDELSRLSTKMNSIKFKPMILFHQIGKWMHYKICTTTWLPISLKISHYTIATSLRFFSRSSWTDVGSAFGVCAWSSQPWPLEQPLILKMDEWMIDSMLIKPIRRPNF